MLTVNNNGTTNLNRKTEKILLNRAIGSEKSISLPIALFNNLYFRYTIVMD